MFTTQNVIATAHAEAGATAIAVKELVEALTVARGEIHNTGPGKIPFRINAQGQLESVAGWMEKPVRRRGEVELHDAAAFAAFVNRFKNPTTLIFADGLPAAHEDPGFTAVFDYHEAGEDPLAAQWDNFRAVLALRTTEQWDRWVQANGTEMEQAAFADFLESNLPDIGEPDGTTIVGIARKLEGNLDVKWKKHIRAQDGTHQFVYEENLETRTEGNITIPDEFTLVLQPFIGSEKHVVRAKFRYRLVGQRLLMKFVLERLDEILQATFAEEKEKIAKAVSEGDVAVPVLLGKEPKAQ